MPATLRIQAGGPAASAEPQSASARSRSARLTERLRAIATRNAFGERRDQISAELDLSPKTCDSHRRDILERLEARGAADITRIAIAAGAVFVEVER